MSIALVVLASGLNDAKWLAPLLLLARADSNAKAAG